MPDPVTGTIAAVTGGSALLGSRSASKASDAQVQSAQEANQTQLEMYYQSRADQMPWLQAGEKALGQLVPMIEAGPGKFESDPGYQFRLAEGEKALMRQASALGGVDSGRTRKALTRFGQDYGSNEYQNFLNRYYQKLAPYQSLAGVGQTTAGNVGGQAINTGQGIAANQIAAGNARASGYINQANAFTGNLQGGLNAYGYLQGMKPPAPALPGTPAPTNSMLGNATDMGWYTPKF